MCDPGWYIYNVTSACYGSYQTATGGWNRLTCGDTDYNRDCSIPWDVCTSNCGGSCRSIVLDDYRTLCIKYGSEALQTCGYDLTTSGGLFPNGANICKGKEKGVVVYYTWWEEGVAIYQHLVSWTHWCLHSRRLDYLRDLFSLPTARFVGGKDLVRKRCMPFASDLNPLPLHTERAA